MIQPRRLERDSLVYEDGQLAIKHECAVFSEPKIVTLWWGFGPVAKYAVECYLDKPIRELGGGCYEVKYLGIAYGGGTTLRLPDGGQTKPFKVIESDYPCPKVRKGIETRYHDGVWQKYLRSEGWIAA